MHIAGRGDAQGGEGDARASCASPLGPPLATNNGLGAVLMIPIAARQEGEVADPDHFNTDPDLDPAFHFHTTQIPNTTVQSSKAQ